jgi:hypothetical protein
MIGTDLNNLTSSKFRRVSYQWGAPRGSLLPLEILACFAIDGEQNRARVESILKDHHDHHVIWDAFKKLESNAMISSHKSRISGGRREFFFKITEKGLELLISENPLPQTFWNVVLGYCYHNEHQIGIEKVKQFYKLFTDRYLKYSSGQQYTFELDIFDRACENWLYKISKTDKMSMDQIILEILALQPNLTLRELRQAVKEIDEDQLNSALSNYIHRKYEPAEIGPNVDRFFNGSTMMKEKWELLSYNLIKVKHNAKGEDVYRLSLFGVLFVLSLIRYNDRGKLNHGLYHSNRPLLEYYDIIAAKYEDSIPLIFKKWRLVRRTLKTIAAYNFDIILDQHFREKSMHELSAFMRDTEDYLHITCGNKCFFESTKSILEITRRQIGEMQMRGMEQMSRFVERKRDQYPCESIENARKLVEKKIDAVSQLISEITVNLEPVGYDPVTFEEKAQKWGVDSQEAKQLGQFYEIDSIETPIAEEIAFLYYLNLNDEWYFHVMEPHIMEHSRDIVRPIQCLRDILDGDQEIREWFSQWVEELVKYQDEVLKTMSEFYHEIRIRG